MSEHAPNPLCELNARFQKALIDFLNVDLDVALTFAQIHTEAGMWRAWRAIETVRGLLGRVEDFGERDRIWERVDALEAMLKAASDSK
jgi:hypothetical protein